MAHHVGECFLDDPEARLLDGEWDCVAVQVDLGVGVDAGGSRPLEQLRQRGEVEGGRGRCRVVGFA